MYPSQTEFTEAYGERICFYVTSATNRDSRHLPKALVHDHDSGPIDIGSLAAVLREPQFNPSNGWILAGPGDPIVQRFTGLGERRLLETLAKEDNWAPRLGCLRGYSVEKLRIWSLEHFAKAGTEHRKAASAPRPSRRLRRMRNFSTSIQPKPGCCE